MKNYTLHTFPRTRIATFDVGFLGKKKHHVAVLLELDITQSRKMIRELKRQGKHFSFNAWLLKCISDSITKFPNISAFLHSKRKVIRFQDINISMVVEKELDKIKVPIPLVIKRTQEKTAEDITKEIEEAKNKIFTKEDIVLDRKSNKWESLYYSLPGFIRRRVWKFMLKHPKIAFQKMGNVVVTSIGMIGNIHGWFIHNSIHPVSFGVGSILKKPWVVKDEIQIREILHMTVLIDHDVIDGADMARFLKSFTEAIEKGTNLKS